MKHSFPLAELSVFRAQFSACKRSWKCGTCPRCSLHATRQCARCSGAAFTLIELLVVIAIIAILAGLALSTLGYVNKKGAESRAQSEVAALSAAIESYKLDYGIYPSNRSTLYRELTALGGAGAVNTNKVYFEPQPGMTNSATGPFLDPWGSEYGYSNYTTYFELWSTAGNTNNTNGYIRN
jgi:type II secretion system protein G